MPIPANTPLGVIPSLLPANVAAYNAGANGGAYNAAYNEFIVARNAGVAANGSLSGWIGAGGAARSINALLNAYGMDARNSTLVPVATLQAALAALPPASINWIAGIALPVRAAPAAMINPATAASLATELSSIYGPLSAPGAVTVSGGFVAASKSMHCLFPDLVPMIDGAHTGLSYYNIARNTYLPPLGLANWAAWLGWQLNGTCNPSPRGAGRNSWQSDQMLAAIGINQHIYELWNTANGMVGLPGFLALDKTVGTTGIPRGIPRVVDKGLW